MPWGNDLNELQSDKLSGDDKIFQVWPYLNSLIITKLPFSQQEHVQISPLPSPSKTCVLPFDFTLERDQKNIFYYQCDVENYWDQVLNFLLFDRHESSYLCHRFNFFLCPSRFDWQNRLFPDDSFSEELASYWLLTLYATSFFRCK